MSAEAARDRFPRRGASKLCFGVRCLGQLVLHVKQDMERRKGCRYCNVIYVGDRWGHLQVERRATGLEAK